MRTAIAWGLAGLAVIGLWWAMTSSDGESEGPASSAAAGEAERGNTDRLAAAGTRIARGTPIDVVADRERDAPPGTARPLPDAEDRTATGGSSDAGRPRTQTLRPQAIAPGDATQAPADRPGEEAAEASDADLAAEQEQADLEAEAARLAEEQEIFTQKQLDEWVDREMRRSGLEYDDARAQVLTRAALANHIARQKAGPDASPSVLKALFDQAWGLVPGLSPEVRARYLDELTRS